MSAVIRCPACAHEWVADLAGYRSSTMRSLDAAKAPIRDDAPMCVCGHVKVLHADAAAEHDHNGVCSLCGDGNFCGAFVSTESEPVDE